MVMHGLVPGDRAMELWARLRDAHSATGVWPVFRGAEFPEDPTDVDPHAILNLVPRGSFIEVLQERLIERCAQLRELHVKVSPDQTLERIAALADASGVYRLSGNSGGEEPWPSVPMAAGPLSFRALSDIVNEEPHERVGLSLLETSDPSSAPAWLGFGGWNEVPYSETLVAVLDDWGRRFGATPACITSDTIECHVERPPQSERESLALAAEHWLLCEDIVGQGTQSVRALAMEFWRAPRWFFWWD